MKDLIFKTELGENRMDHPVEVRSYNLTYKLSYKLYDHSTNIYE